ncbi:hypothetical protein [Nesterenkonia alba]|uniref:hypothetical protein n=1 Tax=Nesterenkonia alba TaxID=515814 RepID=UPI000424B6D2|nr:hypothetical protein [Nesterenkonia alba]
MSDQPMTPAEAKRRKRRALLAAGAIVGIGGAITLATWVDQEFAQAEFDSAQFALAGQIEGSVDSEEETYTQNPEDAPAGLQFDVDEDGLMPDTSVAASYWVRLTADTIDEAELSVSDIESSGGNIEHLSYEIYADGNCSASSPSGDLVASGDTLESSALTQGSPATLTPNLDVNEPGDPVELCVVVTSGSAAGEDGFQPGESTTITWGLTADATGDGDDNGDNGNGGGGEES